MKLKTKQGEVITFKEFRSRFKKGVEGITQLQQLNIQIRSTWIIIIGLIGGLVISIINFKSYWWLSLILFGGLINTLVQLLGLVQKRKIIENIEKQFESIEIKN